MDIEELTAIEEIKRLKARYFRAVDEKDWESFRALFADDVRVWYPGAGRWLMGADEVVAYVRGRFAPGTVSVHHGFMPEIDVSLPSRARGIWAMRDDVEMPCADGRVRRIRGAGHYRERYGRDDAGWKITELVLTRLRVDDAVTEILRRRWADPDGGRSA